MHRCRAPCDRVHHCKRWIATSLSVHGWTEYEATRESYRRTVKNAEACNISFETPWIWLGGGERRRVTDKHDADTGGDPAWNYDIAYSWILGREISDPFYAEHPLRFAPWNRARRFALYPTPLDASCADSNCHSSAWQVPPVINATTGAAMGGDVLSSVTLRHFVAYVKGAAGIRLNDSAVTTKTKTDDTTAVAHRLRTCSRVGVKCPHIGRRQGGGR